MLSDFLMLEVFYNDPSAALFLEDATRRYGVRKLAAALCAGNLSLRNILLGPDRGRCLIGLTEKGRMTAREG